MTGVEGKSKSLAARSVGLLRRVGESVLLGVVFAAFCVLCVFAPRGFVSDLQY